jgi:hypothetical protein
MKMWPVFYDCVKYNMGVTNGEGSGVSGPIQSIKMYSCVQCAMQEKSVCCRVISDVPCLAIWSRDLTPSTQGTCPPSLICLATRDLVYL